MSRGLDLLKAEAALRRVAYKAVYGTPEERSGRFIIRRHAHSPALEVRFPDGENFHLPNVRADISEALLEDEPKEQS